MAKVPSTIVEVVAIVLQASPRAGPRPPLVGSDGTNQPTIRYIYAVTSFCQALSGVAFLLCDSPISEIDPKGYETGCTYDPAHGGVLTKALPADAKGVVNSAMEEAMEAFAKPNEDTVGTTAS